MITLSQDWALAGNQHCFMVTRALAGEPSRKVELKQNRQVVSLESDLQQEPKAVSGPLAPIHFSKALFNTLSLYLYPFIFHCICLSFSWPVHPHLPLRLPLSLHSSITLSHIHLSFDLRPHPCPCVHGGVYKALNLEDYLHRFPLPLPHSIFLPSCLLCSL